MAKRIYGVNSRLEFVANYCPVCLELDDEVELSLEALEFGRIPCSDICSERMLPIPLNELEREKELKNGREA